MRLCRPPLSRSVRERFSGLLSVAKSRKFLMQKGTGESLSPGIHWQWISTSRMVSTGESLSPGIHRQWISTSRMVMSDDGVQKARTETEVNSDLSEKHYHLIADDTFDALMDEFLGEVEDHDDLDDVDINYSQGVMAIKLGPPHGTWVINKQTPNRQIWWSSPISGPMRYELSGDVDVQEAIDEQDPIVLVSRWKNTKDGSDLLHRLRDELKSAINIDILSGHNF